METKTGAVLITLEDWNELNGVYNNQMVPTFSTETGGPVIRFQCRRVRTSHSWSTPLQVQKYLGD